MRDGFSAGDGVTHDVAQRDLVEFEFEVSRVNSRELGEVVHHPDHPVYFEADLAVIAVRFPDHAILERF